MSLAYLLFAIVGLLLLGAFAALVYYYQDARYQHKVRKGTEKSLSDDPTQVNPADMECCGQHEVCEKDSLLAALSREIEYYNDEELDRFRGKSGADYTSTEAEEFRDVLYTMRSEEVAGWVRSLQLRMINLPDEVKDEVFLVVGERRISPTQ